MPNPMDAHAEAIGRIVDYAFWQLMLVDDAILAGQLVDIVVERIQAKWADVRSSIDAQVEFGAAELGAAV